MSTIKRLLEHTSIYVLGEIIIMAGGLISFPIIARLLTRDQYGAMTLVSVSISIVAPFATLGLNHSTLRFHPEYQGCKEAQSFYSTLLISSFTSGIVATVFAIAAIKLFSIFHDVSFELWRAFLLASLLIIIRVMFNIICSIYRVREQPVTYSFFSISAKYVPLGLIILALTIWHLGLFGYFFGLVVGELTVLTVLLLLFVKQIGFSINKFSFPILKKTITYGFPLVLFGLAGVLLSSSDRYLIGYFLTKSDVAIYSVARNLCFYVTGVLLSGFQLGFIPLIMKNWEQLPHEETHLEIQRVIRLYCMVAFPLVVGLCSVGQEAVIMLASEKYAQAFYVLPYLATVAIISGLCTPLTLGFWFYKQTKRVALLMMQTATLNFLINLVLIPTAGLFGAAISTLFCYLFFLVVGSIKSSKYFKIKIPWYPIVLYGICAFLMYVGLKTFSISYPGSHLFTQIGVGIFSYALFLFFADKKLRRVSVLRFRKLLNRGLV